MKTKALVFSIIIPLTLAVLVGVLVTSFAKSLMPHNLATANPSLPVTITNAPTVTAIGQSPAYFQQKWGAPASASKDAQKMDWVQNNMRASVSFKNNQADTIVYTLQSYKWTNEQVSAALAANGSNWQMVLYSEGASQLSTEIMASTGIARWRSAEGNEASLLGPIMTIKSAANLLADAQAKTKAEQRQKAVPNF